MENSVRKLILLMSLLFACVLGQSASAQSNSCQVAIKRSKLAMDQRDDLRLKCLKQKSAQLKVPDCLKIAQSMEYSTNAEDARLMCLYDLKKALSLKECASISKSMEYADSGDEARWECIRRFNRVITKKQCDNIAKKMSYPANSQRAELYCESELL